MRIHKVAAAALMSIIAAGSLIAATTAPVSASTPAHPGATIVFTTVKVTPAKNLVDKQVVKVNVTDQKSHTWSGDSVTTLYFAECSPLAVSKLSEDYCDTSNIATVTGTALKGSTAKANLTIDTSTAGDFNAANKKAVCGGFGHLKCIVLVVDSTSTTTVTSFGQTPISFKDLRPLTKTKVTSKKTVKLHKALKFKVRTTHAKGTAHPTGKVVFRDGKKKLKTVKESKSGKVTFKGKFSKAGKHHITATYSGDKNYQPSVGKVTITVKK